MKRTIIITVVAVASAKIARMFRQAHGPDRLARSIENFAFSKQVDHLHRIERRAERRARRQNRRTLTGHNVDPSVAATSSGYYGQATA